MSWLWLFIALLVVLGGASVYRSLHDQRRAVEPELTDDVIRRLERGERIDAEDPLDVDQIREAEERFWEEERWDEADEW